MFVVTPSVISRLSINWKYIPQWYACTWCHTLLFSSPKWMPSEDSTQLFHRLTSPCWMWFWECGLRPVQSTSTSASPGTFLPMKIPRLYSSTTESESVGVGPSNQLQVILMSAKAYEHRSKGLTSFLTYLFTSPVEFWISEFFSSDIDNLTFPTQ